MVMFVHIIVTHEKDILGTLRRCDKMVVLELLMNSMLDDSFQRHTFHYCELLRAGFCYLR